MLPSRLRLNEFSPKLRIERRRPPPFGRGGLGVFAFQDVPVRRFAPSSLYLRFILLFHLTSGVTGSAALKHGFLSHRLLRMNVQGCHYILAICLHIEFETMTASGPVGGTLTAHTRLRQFLSLKGGGLDSV